ncbi:hypothetical protein CUN60_06040 [Aquella oligotrophica]|uniref:HTH luxR-type domain-containing protein n=2 Tax=Aquella oligotrophica TaxID=2067065 RepID=A0A2I7N5X1_9NEIS|nr:hypothetical protein CUN60_06040 [Aquella oligotrophica]
MYLKDTNSKYMAVSNKLALECGFSDPIQMIGKSDYDLGWDELAEQFRENDLFIIQSQQKHVSKYLMPQLNEAGTYMMIKTEKSPILDEKNKVIAILGVSMDISPDISTIFENFGDKLYTKDVNLGLTELESKIFLLLTLGKPLKDIGEYLSRQGIVIDIEALMYLKRQIFRKLNINSLAGLIQFYTDMGVDNLSNTIIRKLIGSY